MCDKTDKREVKFVEATRMFALTSDEIYLLRFFLQLEKKPLGPDESHRTSVWHSLLVKIGGAAGFSVIRGELTS
jgi:hypothetical protein